MSSNTRIEGFVYIMPPLKWSQIKDSPLYRNRDAKNRYYPDVIFEVKETTVHTDEGVLTQRTASSIAASDYETSGGSIVNDLEEVIKTNPGHDFHGKFDCFDTDYGSMWRVLVRDNKVITETLRLVWPSDEE